MRKIRIEKITLNMGLGTTVNPEHAKKVLSMVSNAKPIIIKSRKRSTFNVPRKRDIGCKVTIRRNKEEILKRLLEAKDNRLKHSCFDENGNFSFGIDEYINVPGLEYDPKIGILGFDVCVTLERPGFRIKRRRLSSCIGKKHRITKEEAINFVKNKFDVEIR